MESVLNQGENPIIFTLLLPTFNRPEMLRQCVEHLLAQTYQDYEIVIVDQSDSEHTDESVADMSSRIRYIHIPQPGLSHARNIGIAHATGDYICLIDDDAIYPAGALEQVSSVLAEQTHSLPANKRIAILTGTIIDPVSGHRGRNIPSRRLGWLNVLRFPSPCIIIKREFLLKHPFDERFGLGAKFGAGEESDLLFAALHDGQTVWHTNRYIVYHRVTYAMDEGSLARLRSYSYGYGALLRKAIRHYSRFWGIWYFLRSCSGNLLASYLLFWKKQLVFGRTEP